MTKDDLPMMSPDQFRKHMGDLFVIESPKTQTKRLRTVGEAYEIVSLLGSEMTTGMVAVAHELDFSKNHFLGQRRVSYAEKCAQDVLVNIKKEIENPSMIWLFS